MEGELRKGDSGKGQFCGMCWRALRVRGEEFEGRSVSSEDGGPKRWKWGHTGVPGRPCSTRSPRLTQIWVLQNAVRHVGPVAVQVPAFLAEKDLAARTAPAALRPAPRLQHASLLREAPPPVSGDQGDQRTPGSPPAWSGSTRTSCRDRGTRPHLSARAARPPSSTRGLNQAQKPLSARRSSATCWVLDSWRSGP